jgi:hypothetical protein
MNDALPTIVRDIVDQRDALRNHIQALGELVEAKLNSDTVSPRKQTKLSQILAKMQDDFAKLIELKQHDGFVRTIMEKAPEARHSTDQMQRDYDELFGELASLNDELIDEEHGLKTRRHLHGWLKRFSALDRRECELLQKVWQVDLGTID